MPTPLRLDPAYDHIDEHHRGLVFDLVTLNRRQVLKALGFGGVSAGLFTIIGCGAAGSSAGTSANPSSPGATSAAFPSDEGTCAVIPEETAGPFPGDGSNGPNILTEEGVVRQDIRSSFGSSSTVAEGIPLTIQLRIEDADDCVPLAGAAVYLWHCDRDGQYSMYDSAVADENYLRGVQEADDDGVVTFTSIFPGCYASRYPHIHFEVYPSLDMATDERNKIATSQIAIPEDACDTAYAAAGYEQSVQNLGRNSLAGDMVFGDDGGAQQLGTASGDATTGFTVSLRVPVSA